MKAYGNNPKDFYDGDTLSNCINARKSSCQRSDGKGGLRNSKQKRKLRTSLNKSTRQKFKKDLLDGI